MGGLRIAPTFGKACHFQDSHARIERNGEHIAGFDGVSRRGFANAIEAHMAVSHQRGGIGTGADDPRVPEPFVDALTLQSGFPNPKFA